MDMNFLQIQPKSNLANKELAPQNSFEARARKSAEEFEAVFLSQILKSMSTGIKSDGPFGGGHSEEVFQDLLSEQMATQISRNGGIGLSDAIYREILKTQEIGHPNATAPTK